MDPHQEAVYDLATCYRMINDYQKAEKYYKESTTFNEKALCGLGRGVATTGLLPEDGVLKALAALQRFRVLCNTMGIRDVRGIATAAVRDAANGAEFLNRAERVLNCKIELLSGQREARLSALGVISSIHKTNGLVGDLGGGSLELIDVHDGAGSPGSS